MAITGSLSHQRKCRSRNTKLPFTALSGNATRVKKPEIPLTIELPAHSDNPSKAGRFVYDALRTIAQEKEAINDWDDNDYTYLSILALTIQSNKELLSNFIYKPGEPFTEQQVLVAKATLAYIQKKDSEYGYESGDNFNDDDDEKIDWINDRTLLLNVLNPSDLKKEKKEHPIFGDGVHHG